jgi:hypothetical protein
MRLPQSIHILGLLAAAVLIASCAWVSSLDKQDTAEAARFNAYAGKPVDHFMWLIQHRGTAAISSNQLVAWADFDRPYLITVAQPCPDLMLNFQGITSTVDQVYARSDLVAARSHFCNIQSIRPVDFRRMERDLGQNLAGASGKTPASHLRG